MHSPNTNRVSFQHSPKLAEGGMLHVLQMLLLPATHGAKVQRAAAVEARQ